MKLITETIDQPVTFITEGTADKKITFIEGIAAQAGIPNRNRRIYPPEVLSREIDKYIREKVDTGSAMGELQHPQSPSLTLDRVSHIFREVKRTNNDWYAKAALTATPCGAIAEGLLQAGARIGFSTRGLGSLKEDPKNNWNVVQDDYKLAVLADLVADPSAPSAYVKGILEGIEFTMSESGEWVAEYMDDEKKTFKSKHTEQLKDYVDNTKAFNKFFEMMNLIQEEDGATLAALAVQAKVDPNVVKQAWYTAAMMAARQNIKEDRAYIEQLARQFLKI